MNTSTIPLIDLRPLGLKTDAEIAKLLGEPSAFATMGIRADVTMDEALLALNDLLQQLHALLQVIEADPESSETLSRSVSVAVSLASIARSHAVVISEGASRAVAPMRPTAGDTEVRHG